MSNVTGTIRGRATIQESQSPTIYNVSIILANTEVAQLLNDGTKKFTIRVRGASTLKLSYNLGESGTVFLTIPPGSTYTEDNLNFFGTLYFQTSKASQIVEIVEWV